MRARRIPVLLFVLLLAGSFTLAAADAAHGHDGASGKVCQLCSAAHVPGLASANGPYLPPLVLVAFHAPDAPAPHHADPDCSGGVTRAPPFSL
jgi:hypothetical protein